MDRFLNFDAGLPPGAAVGMRPSCSASTVHQLASVGSFVAHAGVFDDRIGAPVVVSSSRRYSIGWVRALRSGGGAGVEEGQENLRVDVGLRPSHTPLGGSLHFKATRRPPRHGIYVGVLLPPAPAKVGWGSASSITSLRASSVV